MFFALPKLAMDHLVNRLTNQILSEQRKIQLDDRHGGEVPAGVIQHDFRAALAHGLIFASQVNQKGVAFSWRGGFKRGVRPMHQPEPAGVE